MVSHKEDFVHVERVKLINSVVIMDFIYGAFIYFFFFGFFNGIKSFEGVKTIKFSSLFFFSNDTRWNNVLNYKIFRVLMLCYVVVKKIFSDKVIRI